MSIKNELIPKRRFEEFENADAWEQRKLGEVSQIVGGGTPSTGIPEYWDGDIDWYSPVEIGEEIFVSCSQRKITQLGLEKSSAKILPEGTVLFTSRAGIGNTAILEKEGCTNQGFQSIVPKDNELDSYFIFSCSHLLKKYGETKGAGSTFVEISGKQMSLMPLNIPEIKEQKSVGNFFRKLDSIITLHQRKLDKLKETKIAYISEMFPKEGNLKPERRFKGYKNEWESINLEQIATMNARIGWQNLRTSEFLKEGDYMLITGTDFENGKVDFSTCHFVSKERYEQDTNIQVQNGSILITKDGTLGKVAYVEDLEKPATLNAGVFNVRIKDQNKVDEVFLFQYLRAPFLMRYVNERATGGTIKHLNQNILVKFPILLPEKEEQIRIGKFLTKLDKMIESQQRVLSKLIDLKNAYLNEMFV